MLAVLPIALFALLYCLRRPRSVPPTERLAEALSVFLFAYAILSALLTLFQRYDHLLVAWILATAMGAVTFLGHRHTKVPAREVDADTLTFVLVGAVFLAFAGERSEFVAMGADAGVYCNYAKNLDHTGGSRYELDLLGGRLGPSLAIDTWGLGIYCVRGSQCYYQFFPGWPSILALGMHVFGPFEYRRIMLVVGVLFVFWCFRILREWLEGWRLVAASLCMALNPLLIYFTKYTTSELFLALCVVFAVHAFLRRSPTRRTLALFAAGAFAVSHISSFLHLPLLLTYGAYTARDGGRRELGRFSAATGIFLTGLALGYLFSPQYYVDIFAKFGEAIGQPLPFYALPGLAATGALSCWAWVIRCASGSKSVDV